MKPDKQRKCRNPECKMLFTPQNGFHVYCDYKCALKGLAGKYLADKKLLKRARYKADKEVRELRKTHSEWMNELQVVFNTFIRCRDKGLPCISCGTTANVKYDAGHYYAMGNYQALRFNEDNCHKQCSNNCNKHKRGNLHEYRSGLLERIGIMKLQWLDGHCHDIVKMSIPEIKELILHYKQKIKELMAKQNPNNYDMKWKRNKMTECYSCKYRKDVQGESHIRCENPDENMTGHPNGIKNGWFLYPTLFDPSWKTKDCSNYLYVNNLMYDFSVATDTIRCWIDEHKQLNQPVSKTKRTANRTAISAAYNDGYIQGCADANEDILRNI